MTRSIWGGNRFLRRPAYVGTNPLVHHPHLHCVVPGGGLSTDGEHCISCRPGFFLPVRVLSRFFRRCFIERLEQAFERGELEFFSALELLRQREAFRSYLEPLRQEE